MTVLWEPSPELRARAHMEAFRRHVAATHGVDVPDYVALHAWSVRERGAFWRTLLHHTGVVYEGSPDPVEHDPPGGTIGGRFFPDVRLSFAENLLRRADDHPAVAALSESREPVRLTYRQLREQVAETRAGLAAAGVTTGDVVAGFLPSSSEAVIAMLATASLGAVWTSCSPDFGARGVLDRFSQVSPKVLFATTGYRYGGKTFDCRAKLTGILAELPNLQKVVTVPFATDVPDSLDDPRAVAWSSFARKGEPLSFVRLPFNHPLYVMYSSGTTGKPKCIVHGAGGTLLQHAKELMLHGDLHSTDNILYYTTCGWMMWNWLVSSLFVGATVTMYDGAPSHPDLGHMWRLCEQEGLTHFGTSAKFLGSCRGKITPRDIVRLTRLRVIFSTGSPLSAEDFDWVYQHVERDVMLASISGGTDILGCFMLGNPLLPVHRGEIQAAGLGMDIAALDEQGRATVGIKGELACRAPFVSMPIYFWDDPNHERYRKAYFEQDPGIWRHGDFIEITGTVGDIGGVVVHGRSDATLNPGGVRIGTAEIYRLVETLPEVADSLVVGQPHGGDVRVVLFVQLAPGAVWSPALSNRLVQVIREGATPRHVPAVIRPVQKIPYTVSGKKVEIAVRDLLCGIEPKNQEALSDPSALDEYRGLAI